MQQYIDATMVVTDRVTITFAVPFPDTIIDETITITLSIIVTDTVAYAIRVTVAITNYP